MPGCEGTQPAPPALSVTFATSPVTSTPPSLKPVLKNSSESTGKKVELRLNKNSGRPRPRSVAVPNPSSSGSGLYSLDSLACRPEVPTLTERLRHISNSGWFLQAETVSGVKTDNNGPVKPSVTFHTVLELPTPATTAGDKKAEGGLKYKKSGMVQSWRNIFQLGHSQSQAQSSKRTGGGPELRGSHREINIDDAILPENKPLNYRPRPRSEINLSYSIQVGAGCLWWRGIMETRVLGGN